MTSLSDIAHRWAEGGAYLFAGVSGVSITVGGLSLIAIIISILSGLVAITLGGIKLHDRIKYGPNK